MSAYSPYSAREVRRLLRSRGLAARRDAGQNFLVDREVADRIVDAAELGKDDCVLEIGPGLGALTFPLAAACRQVHAVEVDRGLAGILQTRFADDPRVTVRHGDALRLDWGELLDAEPCHRLLVSNLPYSITKPVLRRLIDQPRLFARAVVMVQQEVAGRLTAEPRTRSYGALSVMVQSAYTVSMLRLVGADCFFPAPSVVSAVVRLEPRADGLPDELHAALRQLVRAVFAHRRKTIRNNLVCAFGRDRSATVLAGGEDLGVSQRARAEELSPPLFVRWAERVADQLPH